MNDVMFRSALFFCSKPPAYYVKSIVHISHYKSVKGQFFFGNVVIPAELLVNVKNRVQSVSFCHVGHNLTVVRKGEKRRVLDKRTPRLRVTISGQYTLRLLTSSRTKKKRLDYPQSARQFSKYIHKSNFITLKSRLMRFRGIQNAKAT